MPDQPIVEFTTKDNRPAIIRYPDLQDAPALTKFINAFSKEDLFTRFAGEQVSLEEEMAYLQDWLQKIDAGDGVKLFCFVEGKLAGVADVARDLELWTRRRHSGKFGIIVGKEFRGQGIGSTLLESVLNEAYKKMDGLKQIKLTCFANNQPAQALYKQQGFVECGRVPNALFYRGKYVDEIMMVRE